MTDKIIQIPELKRYEHLVKHFDKQLLKQLKDRGQKTNIDTEEEKEIEKDDFHRRVIKIETEGILRNRIYYEFIDDKKEFDDSNFLFHNEISLALKDGLITDIGNIVLNNRFYRVKIDS